MLAVQTNNATFGYTAESRAAVRDRPAAGDRARPLGRARLHRRRERLHQPRRNVRRQDHRCSPQRPARVAGGPHARSPSSRPHRSAAGVCRGGWRALALAGARPVVSGDGPLGSSRAANRTRRPARRMKGSRRLSDPIEPGARRASRPTTSARTCRGSSRRVRAAVPDGGRARRSTTTARTAPARSPTSWPQRDPQVHVLHRPGKQGLGAAYLAGFAWALEHGYDVRRRDGRRRLAPARAAAALLDALRGRRPGHRLPLGARAAAWSTGRCTARRSSVGGNLYTRVAARHAGPRRHRRVPRLPRQRAARPSAWTTSPSQGYCFQVDLTQRAVRRRAARRRGAHHLRRARDRRLAR